MRLLQTSRPEDHNAPSMTSISSLSRGEALHLQWPGWEISFLSGTLPAEALPTKCSQRNSFSGALSAELSRRKSRSMAAILSLVWGEVPHLHQPGSRISFPPPSTPYSYVDFLSVGVFPHKILHSQPPQVLLSQTAPPSSPAEQCQHPGIPQRIRDICLCGLHLGKKLVWLRPLRCVDCDECVWPKQEDVCQYFDENKDEFYLRLIVAHQNINYFRHKRQ